LVQGCQIGAPQTLHFFLAAFFAGFFAAAFLAGAFFAAAFAISISPVSVEFPHESLVRKKALLFFNALVDSQSENSREYL
jgi:cytochrome b subunit of formate dehydrogenase